jgi:hypothetical protein
MCLALAHGTMKRLTIALAFFAFGLGCTTDSAFDPPGGAAADGTKTEDDVYRGTSERYALEGYVLGPKKAGHGYVVVQGQKIVLVLFNRAPTENEVDPKHIIKTNGIISPGFIELHNHTVYNFIPLWDHIKDIYDERHGERFTNRYQWTKEPGYQKWVKDPYFAIKKDFQCEADKYGELRAIVGGTTMTEGGIYDKTGCTGSWARNVESKNFGHQDDDAFVLNIIDHLKDLAKAKTLDKFRDDLLNDPEHKKNDPEAGSRKRAFFTHLSEGIDGIRHEFDDLDQFGLQVPQMVGIHATALTRTQIEAMGEKGMSIVWSPLSNLILYGRTTNIKAAREAGVKISLAPDWSPSGSANMLGEFKVAERVTSNPLFGVTLTPKDLWEMATSIPAQIAGLDHKSGTLQQGRRADIVVIKGDVSDPYAAVVHARPQDVLLTLVSGEPFYGEGGLVAATGGDTTTMDVVHPCDARVNRLLRVVDKRVTKGGDETLGKLEETFKNAFAAAKLPPETSQIAPLFECKPAADWIFERFKPPVSDDEAKGALKEQADPLVAPAPRSAPAKSGTPAR